MEFCHNGQSYPVALRRGRYRNINLRIGTDGTIRISAPQRVSDAAIREFLGRHADWIASAAQARQAQQPQFTDGAAIPWLGETLTLRWMPKPCQTVRDGQTLCVFARSEEEAAYAFGQWRIVECNTLFKTLNAETQHRFLAAGYAVPLARLQIKEMDSRWGSCTAAAGRISMNLRLMHYPIASIRAIFCHEYAHFLHQDHSPAFHAVLRQICPDYDSSTAALRSA